MSAPSPVLCGFQYRFEAVTLPSWCARQGRMLAVQWTGLRVGRLMPWTWWGLAGILGPLLGWFGVILEREVMGNGTRGRVWTRWVVMGCWIWYSAGSAFWT